MTEQTPDTGAAAASQPAAPATRVVRNDDEHRYEIWYEGELAGFTVVEDRGPLAVFPHTVIDEAFGGKGLGSVLARQALDDVIARGQTIVPLCPFIAGYLKKHPEYEEHVRWPSTGTGTGTGDQS